MYQRSTITILLLVSLSFILLLTDLPVIYSGGGPNVGVYDFIVVGAGSTGSIVGARLASAGFSVLLLEAGGATQHSLGGRDTVLNELTVFDIPQIWRDIHTNDYLSSRYLWPLIERPHAQICRTLGGCSVVNAMIYVRGVAVDFKEWPEEWQWSSVLPFYKRSERQRDYRLINDSIHHGHTGEMFVSSIHIDDRHKLASLFIQSARNSGMPYLFDFNSHTGREGCGYYQFLIRNGRRESPASALFGSHHSLLCPHHQISPSSSSSSSFAAGSGRVCNSSLTVLTRAHVTRVLFDKKSTTTNSRIAEDTATVTATGVEFVLTDEALIETEGRLYQQMDAEHSAQQSSHTLPKASTISSIRGAINASNLSWQRVSSLYDSLPRRRAYARYEVILSAGAINTPKLLMLSGVGPRDHLLEMGLSADDIIVDLPGVGSNLMDGAKVIMQYESRLPYRYCHPLLYNRSASAGGGKGDYSNWPEDCREDIDEYMKGLRQADEREKRLNNEDALHQMTAKQADSDESPSTDAPFDEGLGVSDDLHISYGPLGSTQFSAGAFLRSSADRNKPDIQLTVFPFDTQLRKWPQMPDGVLTIEVALNDPDSSGKVRLRSLNPFAPPLVDLSYFTERSDIDRMLSAITHVRRLLSFPPLNSSLGAELLPGTHLSSDQLRDYVLCGPREFRRRKCDEDQRVLGHYAGTLRMGDAEVDAMAGVDATLRVVGIQGLRVADASVMPTLPSANTHATCMMIGEKAAHILLQEYDLLIDKDSNSNILTARPTQRIKTSENESESAPSHIPVSSGRTGDNAAQQSTATVNQSSNEADMLPVTHHQHKPTDS